MFATRQRRKSAKKRVCKYPRFSERNIHTGYVDSTEHADVEYRSADYFEFGPAMYNAMYFAAEIYDRMVNDDY